MFSRFANETSKAKGSVRNYYYKTIKTNFESYNLPERMRPCAFKEFTKEEELNLLIGVFSGIKNGKSVRKCVYELAENNDKLALRYLNKYRALIKENSPLISRAEEIVGYEFKRGVSSKNSSAITADKLRVIEGQINAMLDRLLSEVKRENELLKSKVKALQNENERLKSVVKESMRQKNFTKEYFTSFFDRDAK